MISSAVVRFMVLALAFATPVAGAAQEAAATPVEPERTTSEPGTRTAPRRSLGPVGLHGCGRVLHRLGNELDALDSKPDTDPARITQGRGLAARIRQILVESETTTDAAKIVSLARQARGLLDALSFVVNGIPTGGSRRQDRTALVSEDGTRAPTAASPDQPEGDGTARPAPTRSEGGALQRLRDRLRGRRPADKAGSSDK